VLVRREPLVAVKGFKEAGEIQYGEDYDLWMRLLQHGAMFCSLPQVLGKYRIHGGQASGQKQSMLQVIYMLHSIETKDALSAKKKQRAFCCGLRGLRGAMQ